MRKWLVSLVSTLSIAMILAPSDAYAAENKDDPNDPIKALTSTISKLDRKDTDRGCTIDSTIDFNTYRSKLEILREAYLNKDNSVDFYGQRAKQVLAYVIVKRIAAYITAGLYNDDSPPETKPCRFSLSVMYYDKFGQEQNLLVSSWRFNKEQNAKVNWDKFEVKNFDAVALDFKYNDNDVLKWLSDEPQGNGTTPAPEADPAPAQADESCDMYLFNANAIFVRATTFCRKNYMDSPAGYMALEGSKKCVAAISVGEAELKRKVGAAMLQLDNWVRRSGRVKACATVESISHNVISGTRP